VTILPDLLTDPTANLAIGLLFAVARNIVRADNFIRSGQFDGYNPNRLLGKKITGETLGIIGAGRIGTAVVKKMIGFEMRIRYVDPKPNVILEKEYYAKRVDLDTLLETSDYVSLHVPYASDNHHMIGKREFRLMKPDAIIINTSRGKVVDELALVEALINGNIAGAGLDVFENEPELADGLKTLPNVALSPHLGSATHHARAQMAIQASQNLLDCLDGRIPPTCLNP
jgi:lactate dehydrogenase-like 2-hydroxyacid dehydrogenase